MKNFIKMNTGTRTKVAKGVRKNFSGTYEVRKMVNGKTVNFTFTNKAKAIKFYKSL